MSVVLERWNGLTPSEAARAILPCCGSQDWARELTAGRPFAGNDELFAAAEAVWWSLPVAAWREAFDSHPRIGQGYAQGEAAPESLRWSEAEQKAARTPNIATIRALADANTRYEARFGRIFIVCASGRTAGEILTMLEARLGNDAEIELQEAAEQQGQITQLRLRRWLEE